MDRDILKETSGFCVGLMAVGFGIAGAGFASVVSGAALVAVSAGWYSEHSAARRHVEAAQRAYRASFLRSRGLEESDVAAMDIIFQGAMTRFSIGRDELRGLLRGGDFENAVAARFMDLTGVAGDGHSEISLDYLRGLIVAGLAAAMEDKKFRDAVVLQGILAILENQQGGIPRAMFENIAMRFAHDNPDAPVPELEAFLKDKAKEWKALKVRLAALEAGNARLANVRAEAEAALERGDFDAARTLLDGAIEITTDAAVEALRKVAEIHTLKAETWLLQGDADAAAESFETGAMLFTGVDRMREAEARGAAAFRLYENGKRFGGTGLLRGIEACRRNDAVWTREAHALKWAGTRNNLAVMLEAQAALVNGGKRTALLAEAEAACRDALEIHTGGDRALLRAGTQNCLAGVLVAKADTVEGAAGASLLTEAIAAYASSAAVYTLKEHPEHWAALQNNRAIALRKQAGRTEGAAGAAPLAEAVAAYRLALNVFTRGKRAADWAMTQNNLGVALRSQAERVEGAARAALLKEAVEAYHLALEVRTRKECPSEWAVTRFNLGMALEAAGNEDPAERAKRYREALASYDDALEEFEARDMRPDHLACAKCRERVAGKLAAML